MDERASQLVRIGGKVINRALQDSDPIGWQKLLQMDYRLQEQPECLCWGSEKPMPMSIARHGDSLVLRRMPMSGPLHHPMCSSHGGHTSRSGAAAPGFAHDVAGALATDIKLDVPMNTLTGEVGAESSHDLRELQRSIERTTQTTLMGFMYLVWERAGLNHYNPLTDRFPKLQNVYATLLEEMSDLSIGGEPCLERIFVPRAPHSSSTATRNANDLQDRYAALLAKSRPIERPILLVMAQAKRIIPTKYGFGMLFNGMPNDEPVWMSHEALEKLKQRFPRQVQKLVNGRSDGDWRIWCTVGVQMSQRGAMNWVYGALMETIEQIPVESSYEATLIGALVRQGRAFLKPLRYLGHSGLLPDCILLDTVPPVTMEVFGMDTPEYRERKEEKLRLYAQRRERLWIWDAYKKGAMPAFPLDRVAA